MGHLNGEIDRGSTMNPASDEVKGQTLGGAAAQMKKTLMMYYTAGNDGKSDVSEDEEDLGQAAGEIQLQTKDKVTKRIKISKGAEELLDVVRENEGVDLMVKRPGKSGPNRSEIVQCVIN